MTQIVVVKNDAGNLVDTTNIKIKNVQPSTSVRIDNSNHEGTLINTKNIKITNSTTKPRPSLQVRLDEQNNIDDVDSHIVIKNERNVLDDVDVIDGIVDGGTF